MSWLKNIVRPKILTRTKKDVKASVWQKCPGCADMIYGKDLKENLMVCPNCDYHMAIKLDDRLDYLLDDGTVEEIKILPPKVDPLKFKDRKSYSDRLKEAKKKTGADDAFKVVKAKIQGQEVIVCAFNFEFMAGSMGSYVGEAIVQAAHNAVAHKLPLLIIPASGGARMQEGILSLMQMARTSAAILQMKDLGLPYLVLLTNPTTGGVTASFAMLGDVHMAEPNALIGFAGPRVIQQTIGETLPEGFQRSEYLLEHGMVDMVTARKDQPQAIAKILKVLT